MLTGGTVLSGVIGLLDGSYTLESFFKSVTTGIGGMMELVLLAILIGGMVELIQYNGGIQYLMNLLTRNIRSKKEQSLVLLVNLALSILPQGFIVAGIFVIGAFISLAMGTSREQLLLAIAVGISGQTDISIALTMATVVGGAMFGDNLSFISDTTIAAVRSQGTEMKDKFKTNF